MPGRYATLLPMCDCLAQNVDIRRHLLLPEKHPAGRRKGRAVFFPKSDGGSITERNLKQVSEQIHVDEQTKVWWSGSRLFL